jgi:hypothetical protein
MKKMFNAQYTISNIIDHWSLIIGYLSLVVLVCIGSILVPAAQALTMTNGDYIIQMGNLNTGAGKGSNGQYGLTETLGQIAPGLYSGTNYKVRAGFQYIYSIIPFSFKITPLQIDFGTLNPTNLLSRTQTITVSNGSGYGYAVTVAENHQLLVPSKGAMIPNTSCDSGTCTTSTANAWTGTYTFGFGYRCEYSGGSTCASDFNGANFFRPFADKSLGQTSQVVVSSANVHRAVTETITYQVNISAAQAPGDYSNVVEFIATPTF